MFLKNRNIGSKIKRSKVTDYAALISKNIVFFLFPISNREKHWTYQLLPINVLAWWFKLSKYSSMFYSETWLLYFFTFWWIRAMCLHQVEKYVTGPWISWHFVYIFLTYMESLYVEMVSWQRPQRVKILIQKFDWIQNIQLKIGVPSHKNYCPPAILIHTKSFIVSTNLSMI